MKNKDDRSEQAAPSPDSGQALRRRAEEIVREEAALSSEELEALSPEETRQTLHELRVHQIELEMQNEELRRAQAELDAARARYFDLYDLAPVGYFTVSEQGLILEANLTAGSLLGVARGSLIREPLTRFILPKDQDIYYRHRKQLFGTGAPQVCELRMLRVDAAPFWVRIEAMAGQDVGSGEPLCRAVMSDITESKRAQRALEESEAKMRSILDNIGVGVALISPAMEILELNRQMREWFPAADPGEHPICHRAFNDPPREEPCHYCPTYKTLRDGLVHEATTQTPQAGVVRNYRIVSSPILDAVGEVRAAIEMVEDITERVKAEESLRESEKEMRWLLKSMLNAFVLFESVFDAEDNFISYRFVYINNAYERITGVKNEEVKGKTVHEVWPETEAEWVKKYGEVAVTGVGQTFELYHDPTKKLYHCNVYRPWDTKDRFCVIFEDITERKQAEEALRESMIRLELATAATNIGHWDWNLLTNNVYFSPLWKSQLGYEDHEVPNRFEEWETRLHPDDRNHTIKAVNDYIEGRSPEYVLEFRLRHKDGTYRWIYTRAEKHFDEHGRPCRLFGCHIDVTERKRMEEDMLRSQKIESVGILAGGIAHDFNNILTTMMGNISMAKDQVMPEDDIFELLNEAEVASRKAQALTKQLLTFAKGGTPVKEIASIKEVLKEASLFVLRGSKSSCEFSIDQDLRPTEVDVGQLSQVINNIVINANQAMPGGGIIQVAAENLIVDSGHGLPLSPGRYIRISITDQGLGIPEKYLSKVFDPYFTTKQEGSGLGLATTYSIIKKHDGHITVESTLGEGTTFYIYLPASEKEVPERVEAPPIRGHGRILVMDDEAALRKMVERMLKRLGYESEFAKDGSEAIRMVKEAKEAQKPYDAVILDLTIPGGMGGKEAIKKILEIDPEVKAIVSSGYSDDPVLANFQEYGFQGMMPKPFASESLSKVLHEILRGEEV